MSEGLGTEFFAEVGGLIVDELHELGVFSAGYQIAIAIKNNTSKPWKLAYCETTDSSFQRRPDNEVPVGGTTNVIVKPPSGFMNLDYHMECDFYYNKTDKEEAFFRAHFVRNQFSANEWGDTKPWNSCKFSTFEVLNPPMLDGCIWAKIIVSDA